MKITEAKDAYTTLWLGLTGDRVSPSHAEHLLTQKFTAPTTKNKMCVVLVDELDLILTKKQSVVYNFFDWPNHAKSKMVVVAIANTMDLPERMLSNKVSSRLGLNRIVFEPYKYVYFVLK
jgi:origin recognition complex subunit 1